VIALVLRHRFILQPVLLSSVIEPFVGIEHTGKLYNLVKEYTPEEYGRLGNLTPLGVAQRFAEAFSKSYFLVRTPDPYTYRGDGGQPERDAVQRFVYNIPLEWRGLRRYDYDSGGLGLSHQLAGVLCECPFTQNGPRLAILDRFKKNAGAGPAKLLPANGWPLEDIEPALEGSPWPGLLDKCRWLFHRTGNLWLDNDHGAPGWERQTVDDLARDWLLYLEADKRMREFDSWLGHAFPSRAAEVIKYVKERIGNGKKS
jgi:hypothetical protein